MTEEPAPYGEKRKETCPLFCGTLVRRDRCQRNGCVWWESGGCSAVGILVEKLRLRKEELVTGYEERLREIFGEGA